MAASFNSLKLCSVRLKLSGSNSNDNSKWECIILITVEMRVSSCLVKSRFKFTLNRISAQLSSPVLTYTLFFSLDLYLKMTK